MGALLAQAHLFVTPEIACSRGRRLHGQSWGSRGVSRGQRHADQRRAAKQQVDADEKAKRPLHIQPRKMVMARLASGGTMIAASPRIARRMPSNRKAFQCAFTAALISDCNLLISCWGRVIGSSRCRLRSDGNLVDLTRKAPEHQFVSVRADARAVLRRR